MVSAIFLSLLGVVPQIGRDFVPADGRPGSPAVALLSDALWRERFSADPRVVGTALDLDGQPYTVAGVLPPRFRFPDIANAPQVLIAMHTPGSSAFNTAEPLVFLQCACEAASGRLPARACGRSCSRSNRPGFICTRRRWRAWPKDGNWKSFPCSATSREIREDR